MMYIENGPIRTEYFRGCSIKIYTDEDGESPRDWDNLGTMVCSHSGYNLGDVQLSSNLDGYEGFYDHLNQKFEITYNYDCNYLEEHETEIIQRWARHNLIILPLYLYDHSGITMSTAAFSCQWDSGQVGFIYTDLETIKKEFNISTYISKRLLDRVRNILIGEVETYDTYIRGDVIGYMSENIHGEDMGSCWGYYSLEHLLEDAKAEITCHIKEMVAEAKKQRALAEVALICDNTKKTDAVFLHY